MSEPKLPTRYVLEIYEPEDDSCVAAFFNSHQPFMSLSKGDYINPGMFVMTETRDTLEVVSVEHILWEIEDSHVAQKVCIRTKIAEQPFA